MQRTYHEILRLLGGRSPFAVATVVSVSGSTPGKPGAKMIVRPDGPCLGTVGGGGLEERVEGLARSAIAARQGGIHALHLSDRLPGGLGSLCGGTAHVAIEVLVPPPHVLLAGGGHVGKALHDVARLLDWRVSVVDGRAAYASAERFPGAVQRVEAGPPWFATADLGPFSHLVVAGRSHADEREILRHALPRFHGTVGLVGSRAKRARLASLLREDGVPAAAIDRIECPVGLPIGAESPAEIALAIAARILEQWRRAPSPPGGGP